MDKRLIAEIRRISREPPDPYFRIYLCGDDLHKLHFSVIGPADTVYAGGIYHGELIFPDTYPLTPPDVILLTPSGRYIVGKRICMTNTSFHPESWQSSWGIRSVLVGLVSTFGDNWTAQVGAMNCDDFTRRSLADKSRSYTCPACGARHELLAEQGFGTGGSGREDKEGEREEGKNESAENTQEEDNQLALALAPDQPEPVAQPKPRQQPRVSVPLLIARSALVLGVLIMIAYILMVIIGNSSFGSSLREILPESFVTQPVKTWLQPTKRVIRKHKVLIKRL